MKNHLHKTWWIGRYKPNNYTRLYEIIRVPLYEISCKKLFLIGFLNVECIYCVLGGLPRELEALLGGHVVDVRVIQHQQPVHGLREASKINTFTLDVGVGTSWLNNFFSNFRWVGEAAKIKNSIFFLMAVPIKAFGTVFFL